MRSGTLHHPTLLSHSSFTLMTDSQFKQWVEATNAWAKNAHGCYPPPPQPATNHSSAYFNGPVEGPAYTLMTDSEFKQWEMEQWEIEQWQKASYPSYPHQHSVVKPSRNRRRTNIKCDCMNCTNRQRKKKCSYVEGAEYALILLGRPQPPPRHLEPWQRLVLRGKHRQAPTATETPAT
jgi:hypothetical protein